MKKLHLLGLFILFTALFNQSYAQGSNYVGNWESTTPVTQYNNLTVRLQIVATSNPDAFIIVNADSPKYKFDAKYNATQDRLYTTLKKKPIYFKYVSASDKLEVYKSKDDTKLYEMVRY